MIKTIKQKDTSKKYNFKYGSHKQWGHTPLCERVVPLVNMSMLYRSAQIVKWISYNQ